MSSARHAGCLTSVPPAGLHLSTLLPAPTVTLVDLAPLPAACATRMPADCRAHPACLLALHTCPQPADHVVMLDERGRDVSSEDLAGLLAKASDQSWPRLVFAIGGPFGHGQVWRGSSNLDRTLLLRRWGFRSACSRVVLRRQAGVTVPWPPPSKPHNKHRSAAVAPAAAAVAHAGGAPAGQ